MSSDSKKTKKKIKHFLAYDDQAASLFQIALEPLENLKPHEQTRPDRVTEMVEKIRRSRAFHKPILVDKDTLVILDGHHKWTAAKELGLRLVPVAKVDYLNEHSITVGVWEESGLEVIAKEDVLNIGLSPNLFPPKSSRHILPFKLPPMLIPLELLK